MPKECKQYWLLLNRVVFFSDLPVNVDVDPFLHGRQQLPVTGTVSLPTGGRVAPSSLVFCKLCGFGLSLCGMDLGWAETKLHNGIDRGRRVRHRASVFLMGQRGHRHVRAAVMLGIGLL